MNWINKYWSIIGGMIAIGIIVTFIGRGDQMFSIESLIWFHLAILLLHQFEEYSFPGKFKEFYNLNIWNKNPITRFQLNNKGVLMVNVVLAWTAYLIAAIYGDKLIWLTIGLSGITILNGIMHTLMFFKLRKYNPGLITGFFMFIPFGLFLIINLKENLKIGSWILGGMVFMIGSILIPLSIRLTNKTKVPDNIL